MTRRNYFGELKSSVLIFVALGLSPGTLFLVSSQSAIKPQYRTCVLRGFELRSLQRPSAPSCLRSLQGPTAYRRRRPAYWDPPTTPKCISSASSPDIGREADSHQEDAPPTEDDTFFPWVFSPSSRRSVRDNVKTPLEDPSEVVRMKAIDVTKASIHYGKAYDVPSHLSLGKGRRLRRMQYSDISRVIGLAIEEYCDESIELEPVADTTVEYIARIWAGAWELVTSQGGIDEGGLESFLARTEMEWMRTMIRWGFSERLSIGERGKDHSVFCVSDERWEERNSEEGGLVALAEVSLKIPNDKTALPVPLPLWVKKVSGVYYMVTLAINVSAPEDFSQISNELMVRTPNPERGSRKAAWRGDESGTYPGETEPVYGCVPYLNVDDSTLVLNKQFRVNNENKLIDSSVPYISNLLVEPKARRQGLARVLMAQCEEQALKWGYSEVFLHVDITYTPAVRLYESLGYKAVGDDPVFEFDDEPLLRYMRKELRS